MLQIKNIKLIALAILLLAGITGGQVWGMENWQSYEQWIDSNDPDALSYKKQIANKELWKQKHLQDMCEVKKILQNMIKDLYDIKEELYDVKLFENIPPSSKDQCNEWMIKFSALLTQRQNLSDKNNNELNELEIARRACFEKKEQKKQQNVNRSYITLICSFIGGIISTFKFGTGLANENKNGLLGVFKNNWKPFCFGTAITCVTMAYSYKKCDKKVDPSPIIIAGLAGHTLGIATGLVLGLPPELKRKKV